MAILVLNCGSSSLKYTLYWGDSPSQSHHGVVDRVLDYASALEGVVSRMQQLAAGQETVIKAVGHRVVHGGTAFHEPVVVDQRVLETLRQNVHLAPLHNPSNMLGVKHAARVLPAAVQVAVFDTAFYHDLPRRARTYAIPESAAADEGIRRYGFHGISHSYVTRLAVGMLPGSDASGRIISCHLGNGCSITAVDAGQAVDTSMGFTPLEGLVMGSRCGDLDPGIIIDLLSPEGAGMSLEEVDDLLNRRSGLLGVSGISADVRELLTAREDGNHRAALALELFTYRLKKYIGSYHAILGGADAVVFTAGIGENSPEIRAEALGGMEELGYVVDPAANQGALGVKADITGEGGKVRILVIPTDEDRMIYKETSRFLK
jgi:acetate kinase